MSTLPIDVVGIISRGLARSRREPDGLLHSSSDIMGPLRHTQLALAGAPVLPRSLTSDVRMLVGTELHEWLAVAFRYEEVPFMSEINLTPWMPPGWGGTCDMLIFNPESKRFRLLDIKTTRGDAIKWLKGEAKPEHVHQVSSYYHAVDQSGIAKLDPVATVLYWPITDTEAKPLPQAIDFKPLPKKELGTLMKSRRDAAVAYVASLPKEALDMAGTVVGENDWTPEAEVTDYSIFHTPKLAPIHPREQVLHRNNAAGTYDLKTKPHWSAGFCDYPGILCGCRNQAGVTKIGHYLPEGQGWKYVPRKGFEDQTPEKEPDQ
jgi:hypothetical protein